MNGLNRQGESALHIASRTGMAVLVSRLLEAGCNPGLQTPPPPLSSQSLSPGRKKKNGTANHTRDDSNPFADDDDDEGVEEESDQQKSEVIGLQSPLHLAVLGGHDDVVKAFVQHAE